MTFYFAVCSQLGPLNTVGGVCLTLVKPGSLLCSEYFHLLGKWQAQSFGFEE